MTSIAETLRDLVLKHIFQPEARELAMTCRAWRRLFSPLWWGFLPVYMTSLSQIHKLEVIISSPLSGTATDHIHHVHLDPRQDNDDKDSSHFFSAWRSLSRYLHQVTSLEIGIRESDRYPQLKSRLISLRPCSRPLLHVTNLDFAYVAFPTFSALFRDIGALPSLERLKLHYVSWNGARDPESPPSSTATFGSIKHVYAYGCTDGGWPLIWIFTTLSLRYRHPWRVPDDEEETRTRSVHADVRAIGQALKWMFYGGGAADLMYVDGVPKGVQLFTIKRALHD